VQNINRYTLRLH